MYAWAAGYVGAVAAITGAYLAGVLIAQTDFKKEIDAGIHPLTYSIFVPLFFISIGLEANGRELGPRAMFTVVLVLVAIVAKAIGCGVFARLFGFSTIESVRVGVGMISRGEVGLIVAGYGLANGLIGSDRLLRLGADGARDDDGDSSPHAAGFSAPRVRAGDRGRNDRRASRRRRSARPERHRNVRCRGGVCVCSPHDASRRARNRSLIG